MHSFISVLGRKCWEEGRKIFGLFHFPFCFYTEGKEIICNLIYFSSTILYNSGEQFFIFPVSVKMFHYDLSIKIIGIKFLNNLQICEIIQWFKWNNYIAVTLHNLKASLSLVLLCRDFIYTKINLPFNSICMNFEKILIFFVIWMVKRQTKRGFFPSTGSLPKGLLKMRLDQTKPGCWNSSRTIM